MDSRQGGGGHREHGDSEITLKTDQESAIEDLQKAVKERNAPHKTTLENSLVDSSGNSGLAARARGASANHAIVVGRQYW